MWLDSDDVRLFKGKGCQRCNFTGFQGRTVISELLVMNDPLRSAVIVGAPTSGIKTLAIQGGMVSLFESGLRKVRQARTTIQEVIRAAGDK